jgi:hypothetical protein
MPQAEQIVAVATITTWEARSINNAQPGVVTFSRPLARGD